MFRSIKMFKLNSIYNYISRLHSSYIESKLFVVIERFIFSSITTNNATKWEFSLYIDDYDNWIADINRKIYVGGTYDKGWTSEIISVRDKNKTKCLKAIVEAINNISKI